MLRYRATREAIPLFALYALLFADHGLSTAQIGTLLLFWSVSAFLLEVPSGAWADVVDRRLLLVGSGLVYAAAFTSWLVWPAYPGFALGFVLWSLSDAMFSGTFEAYLFDELSASGGQDRYGVVKARTESVAVLVMAGAIALAGPLHDLGGHPLVGWVSVGAALLHTGCALALPRVTPSVAVDESPDPEPASVSAWAGSLTAGVSEAARRPPVRRVLAAYGAVVALVGLDEFFPLVLADGGTGVGTIAWVLAGITLLQAAGTWAAGRVARLSRSSHALLVVAGGLLMAGGAWGSGPTAFAALGVGYALATSAYVAGDVRLQHVITGPARATTTSVAGLVAELGFLVTLGAVSLASLRWDLTTTAIGVVLVLTVPAAVTAYRAPAAPPAPPTRARGAERH